MARYLSLFLIILYSGMAEAQDVKKTPALEGHCNGPKWRNEFIPYTSVAGIDGTSTQKGLTANIYKNSGNIPTNANVGAMGVYRITYKNKFMISAEGRFNKLTAAGSNDKQNLNVALHQTQVELAGGVLVHPRLAFIGGTKYNRLGGTTKSTEQGGPEASGYKQWVDPFVGARLNFPLGYKFAAYLRGDLGGFNVGSISSWQVYPVLEYKPKYNTSILIGYRYSSIHYSKGSGSNQFLYNLNVQGLDVGVSMRF